MNRFYIPPSAFKPDALVLTGDEAHHCAHVLRHKPEDVVVVFDGEGHEVKASVTSVDRHEVRLKKILASKTPALPYSITLGQAIPKGKYMEAIIQKATEIGARRICPLLSERTVVSIEPDQAPGKREKWAQTTVEAAKQCGINWLPAVDEPVTLKSFFGRRPSFDLMLIASLQPDSLHFRKVLQQHESDHGRRPSSVLVLIGPEGDFTPAEISLAKGAGCLPITLGPQVLRCETAAIYALSIIAHELQA